MVPVSIQDGCHVGMKKRLAGAPSSDGQGESHKIRVVKGAENLPTCFRCDDKQGNRNDVNI
jgi:hypothetical protein